MATRVVKKIEIQLDDEGATAFRITAQTILSWADGLVSGSEPRTYQVLYSELTTAAQATIDDFVDDVDTWLDTNEPLSAT